MSRIRRLRETAADALVGRCSICGEKSFCLSCARCAARPPLEAVDLQGLVTLSATQFEGRTAELVRRLKYRGETFWADPLGRLMFARARDVLKEDVILVPIPLHPHRLAERGYNQSALLARVVGKAAGISVHHGIVRRITDTSPQAALNGRTRRANVRGAFCVMESDMRPIWLVDDVLTTGSTALSCALCLQSAGAIVIGVLTVARVFRP